jgi:hypothetical protein
MSTAASHELAWVAAGIRRAVADLGVELPAGYALAVAKQALSRGEEVGVTKLGQGVVLSSLPGRERALPFVVGYADASGQWYRDGRRHRPDAHLAPATGTPVASLGAPAL